MQKARVDPITVLWVTDQVFKDRVNKIREDSGIDPKKLSERFSIELDEVRGSIIEDFIRQGLLEREGAHLKATGKGRLVLDEIASRLI